MALVLNGGNHLLISPVDACRQILGHLGEGLSTGLLCSCRTVLWCPKMGFTIFKKKTREDIFVTARISHKEGGEHAKKCGKVAGFGENKVLIFGENIHSTLRNNLDLVHWKVQLKLSKQHSRT